MSVRHAGYDGNGIERYEATRWFSSGTKLLEMVDSIDELRRELFAHRVGMEVEGSSAARVEQNRAGMNVVICGWWRDPDVI